MKKQIKILGAVGILLLTATAMFAADSFSGSGQLFNSASTTNTYTTNGVWPNAIGPGQTTITNILPLKNSPTDTTAFEFTCAANGSSTTNVVVSIYSSVAPVSLSINTNQGANPGAWTNNATTPLVLFDTFTLALNGTTPVKTNRSYGLYTTPAKARGLNLYLYSIQMGAGTVPLTNYSVYVSNQ